MLKIGELAARTGLSRDTIRFYERQAMLPKASRTPAGYRLYSPDMVQRLRFIKQAQALGFSLTEIRHLLEGYQNAAECGRVKQLLEHKIATLDRQMQAIQTLRHALGRYLAVCQQALQQGSDAAPCPVVLDLLQEAAEGDAPEGTSPQSPTGLVRAGRVLTTSRPFFP